MSLSTLSGNIFKRTVVTVILKENYTFSYSIKTPVQGDSMSYFKRIQMLYNNYFLKIAIIKTIDCMLSAYKYLIKQTESKQSYYSQAKTDPIKFPLTVQDSLYQLYTD